MRTAARIPLIIAMTSATLAAGIMPAAALDVVTVPARSDDPTVPHQAYAGHPARLAAIARGGATNLYYRWDANGDGVWDLDPFNPGGADPNRWYQGTAYDLDFRYWYPDPAVDRLYLATIEVSNTPSDVGAAFAVQYVLVKPGLPTPVTDPDWAEHANASQRQVIREVALDDALWHLHQQMVRSGASTNDITGWLNASATFSRLSNSACYLLALLGAGHLPAYPPGTYQDHGVTPPAGFLAANDLRWATDPYAEDAVRLMNYLLANLTYTQALPAADESDDGTVPIEGTNDGFGWTVQQQLYEYAPAQPFSLAALANCGLAGTVAQVGANSLGHSLEFVVQQMVDYVAGAQYDANSGAQAVGGWGYNACLDCGTGASGAFGQHFGWAVYALHQAEAAMGEVGVHVNQQTKLRLPNMLFYNRYTDGGPRYTGTMTWSLFEPTGHFLLACRWLGWDAWDPSDPTVETYPYLSLTRGQARLIYDGLVAYAASRWTTPGPGTLDPSTALWQDGNGTSGVRGHSFFLPMLITSHGPADQDTWYGTHDWAAEFVIDLAYQQYAGSTWYESYVSNHYTTTYLLAVGQTALSALLLAQLAPAIDTVPPDAPATFSVDYAADVNALSWTASMAPDVDHYEIFRGPSQPVPAEPGFLWTTTASAAIDDTESPGWGVCYRLRAVDTGGNASDPVEPTSVTAVPGAGGSEDGLPDGEPPARTALGQAYPNPFNPVMRIPFTLARDGTAALRIFDVRGRLVAEPLPPTALHAGRHAVTWNGLSDQGQPMASGVYVCRLEAGSFRETRRMTLAK